MSSPSSIPFTLGIIATSTAPSASTMTAAASGGMPSGAVGMVELFGAGAAVLVGLQRYGEEEWGSRFRDN